MAVLAHPKYACGRVYWDYAVSMSIYPAFAASRLLQRLNPAFPKAIPVKPIIVIAAVINIRILSSICSCYRASASMATLRYMLNSTVIRVQFARITAPRSPSCCPCALPHQNLQLLFGCSRLHRAEKGPREKGERCCFCRVGRVT